MPPSGDHLECLAAAINHNRKRQPIRAAFWRIGPEHRRGGGFMEWQVKSCSATGGRTLLFYHFFVRPVVAAVSPSASYRELRKAVVK